MTTKAEQKEREALDALVPPKADETRATSSSRGKRPRVAGKLSKAIYLIRDRKATYQIPEVTRETIVTDEDSEDFGQVVEETVVEAYETTGDLPPGTRFGSRKVGVAHEITDAAEAEALQARGFRTATAAEIEGDTKKGAKLTTDQIAARDRQTAHEKLRRMNAGLGANRREKE